MNREDYWTAVNAGRAATQNELTVDVLAQALHASSSVADPTSEPSKITRLLAERTRARLAEVLGWPT